jgi:type II secretory pathway component PulM
MSMIESARNWWEGITPRERTTVAIAGTAVPLIIALWVGMQIQDGLAKREKDNADMRKALRVLADLRTSGPAKPIDDTVTNMPTVPTKLETYMEAAAKKVNITIPRYSPGTAVPKNGFITNSTRIDVNDVTVDQLKSFLQEVEQGLRYVVVTQINIQKDFRDKDKVDVRLEISTYAKEPVAAAAGSGSGSGSSGSAGSGKGN